jgi:ectoine hydroxylase-related dioxygenase (phytanoyl-CoA dioxygenase family)
MVNSLSSRGENEAVDIVRFGPKEYGATIAEVLRRDGCAIVENLASDEQLDRFTNEMQPFLDATQPGNDDFIGRNTRRTGGLVARSATARELVMNDLVLDTTGALLMDRAATFQLHLTQVIAIGPNSPAQTIHRDQWAFGFHPFPIGIDVQCNVLWAVTDFTEANGATRVIPGSNTWEDRLRPTIDQSIPALMERGSALLYTGSLYHGGGPNSSDEVRTGINITYCRSWLRQEENQYLSVPPDIARTLDEDLLRMIGYSRGAYALGYVDDLRDPLDVLLGRDGRTTFDQT